MFLLDTVVVFLFRLILRLVALPERQAGFTGLRLCRWLHAIGLPMVHTLAADLLLLPLLLQRLATLSLLRARVSTLLVLAGHL